MHTMQCTCKTMHITSTTTLWRLTTMFLPDDQHTLNLASSVILHIIVPNYFNMMAHKAHPLGPNVFSELKTVPTVPIKCLLCLLITGSKVILDEFYQAKLQQPAGSFPSSRCTSMFKSLSVIQKNSAPLQGVGVSKFKLKENTSSSLIFVSPVLGLKATPLCVFSFSFLSDFNKMFFTSLASQRQSLNCRTQMLLLSPPALYLTGHCGRTLDG